MFGLTMEKPAPMVSTSVVLSVLFRNLLRLQRQNASPLLIRTGMLRLSHMNGSAIRRLRKRVLSGGSLLSKRKMSCKAFIPYQATDRLNPHGPSRLVTPDTIHRINSAFIMVRLKNSAVVAMCLFLLLNSTVLPLNMTRRQLMGLRLLARLLLDGTRVKSSASRLLQLNDDVLAREVGLHLLPQLPLPRNRMVDWRRL